MNEELSAALAAGVFAGLSVEGRQRLAAACFRREVSRRALLFTEGDEGHSVYLVLRGAVQLHKTTEEGREVVVRVVRPGDLFGEVVVFERSRYPVSAVALADSALAVIPRRALAGLLETEAFRNDFLAAVMRRLRYLTDRLVYMTSYDVEERLLRHLRGEAAGRPVFRLTVSKKDVAAAVGTTPETLSRVVQRLESAEVLSWRGRTVRLRE